ncbi:hypothetical protein AKJ40_00550, partial [candidate division MSBL1 archaeon SCGC-AAA259M10]
MNSCFTSGRVSFIIPKFAIFDFFVLVTGTEDGSAGIKGVTPDVVRKINLGDHYDSCLLCGPEEMMTSTADLIDKKGIPIQVSLNRYMKCGVGICGSCSLDPSGLR